MPVQLGTGEIVNAEPALLDNPVEFVDPGFSAVVHLASATNPEAAGKDGENQRLKPWRKLVVKGAVYKDVARNAARHSYFA